jgi:hypothetical protein
MLCASRPLLYSNERGHMLRSKHFSLDLNTLCLLLCIENVGFLGSEQGKVVSKLWLYGCMSKDQHPVRVDFLFYK